MITDYDLYLFGEGKHHFIYEKLGSHLTTFKGVKGASFALWAPNAVRVSVIGSFNNWNGKRDRMRPLGSSGVWEIFIPDVKEGDLYKYEIEGKDKETRLKSDPYALFSELRPKTASIVWKLKHRWKDQDWMKERKRRDPLKSPLAIYEVHLGSWQRVPEENHRFLTYRELACKLSAYVKEMGFNYIELLPVAEHPFDGSWGYQTTNYFAASSRFGTPDEFASFVDIMHQNKIGVILDWVPAHFPDDRHSLSRFDGTELYEHRDPRQARHPDWHTLIFNYGRHEVRNFLFSNGLFWLKEYHLDGLRIDAVASMLYLDYSRKEGQWIPNIYGGRENLEAISFIKELNDLAHSYFPGVITIAEESTAWGGVTKPISTGGLGFTFKWNMGWMNDTLRYLTKDPVHRKYHQELITFGLLYAFSENFILSLSHDEVVHHKRSLLSKMPGDNWQKFANLRLLLGFMYGYPGKKLLFMSGEFGQWEEWNHESSLGWHLLDYQPHKKLRRFVQDLNRLYLKEPALWQIDHQYEGFEWIDFSDVDCSIISFLRRGEKKERILLFVANFTPVPRSNYRIGVPSGGSYEEILNSDSELYGGSNLGNFGRVRAEEIPWHNRPYSLNLTLPPLAIIIFRPANYG